MSTNFLRLFCSVFIDWCTVLILFYLFYCMWLGVVIDGAQFEDPRGQDFEDVPEQQQLFEEGKWSLIIFRS
jgi:hypothetical protein